MFERKESDNGYILYISTNDPSEILLNDPKLQEILDNLHDFYTTKHLNYRCAGRFDVLKRLFYTKYIPFDMVASIMGRHKLHQADNIKPPQLTAFLYDIFYACDKLGYFQEETDFDVDSACSLLANFIWNVFDPNRCRPLSILELQETLLLFCETNSMEDFVTELFYLATDHNRCVPQYKFKSLLEVLTKILNYIDHEMCCDEKTISEIVQECFTYAECPGIAGLNEYQFYSFWRISADIQFSYYTTLLATMRRINEAKNLIHFEKCQGCHTLQIHGLRFKCLRCKQFSLCLNCFVRDFENKQHSASHKMQEISTLVKVSHRFSNLLAKLCNLFAVAKTEPVVIMNMETKLIEEECEMEADGNEKINQTVDLINETKFVSVKSHQSEQDTGSTPSSNFTLGPPQQNINDKLHAIIDSLTSENRVFQDKLEEIQQTCLPGSEFHVYLERHKNIITEQIEQLRVIWQRALLVPFPHHSSTPYRGGLPSNRNSGDIFRSIRGVEINKTFYEANRSDYNLSDVSSWLHMRKSLRNCHRPLPEVPESATTTITIDSQMINFRDLLQKVKEIVEDSYSDNVELSLATHQLENVLEDIIEQEQRKRIK